MNGLNTILIRVIEVSILLTTVMFGIAKFTQQLEPDEDALNVTEKAAYIAIFFSSISSLSAGSYLLIRLFQGANVIEAIGISIVIGTLIFALVFFVYAVMAILSDYGSAIGLQSDD